MKIQTNIQAGGFRVNYNQTVVPSNRIVTNHNQAVVRRLLLALALLCCSAPQVMAADLCESLDNNLLSVHANGYKFFVAPNGITLNNQNGTYTFEDWTDANPPEKIKGQCKDRHITFTRTLQGNIVQKYDGWIFENNTLMMAGTFSHNSQNMRYGWCAERVFVN